MTRAQTRTWRESVALDRGPEAAAPTAANSADASTRPHPSVTDRPDDRPRRDDPRRTDGPDSPSEADAPQMDDAVKAAIDKMESKVDTVVKENADLKREVADLRHQLTETKKEQASLRTEVRSGLDTVASGVQDMRHEPDVDAATTGSKYKQRLRVALTDASFGMAGATSAYAALGPKGLAYALGAAAATGPAARSLMSLYKTWREGRSADRPED
jgi:hypothetical protein